MLSTSDSLVKESSLPASDACQSSSPYGFKAPLPVFQLNTRCFCPQKKRSQRVDLLPAQHQWVRFSPWLIFAHRTPILLASWSFHLFTEDLLLLSYLESAKTALFQAALVSQQDKCNQQLWNLSTRGLYPFASLNDSSRCSEEYFQHTTLMGGRSSATASRWPQALVHLSFLLRPKVPDESPPFPSQHWSDWGPLQQ